MPLSGLKFAGCTVVGFNSNLGWGNQKTTVKVTVIEDIHTGDLFVPATIGTPVTVSYNSLVFRGILQNWREENSVDGLLVFSSIIEDPRDILDGASLILDNYNGSVNSTPNLLNVYGWWEVYNGSFGSSGVNAGGMPWNLVAEAIGQMVIGNGSVFGGPLAYKGVSYLVDLSNMPVVPAYYRLPGHDMTLLHAITTVCNDANYDFYFDIQPATNIIRVRTYSRQTAITPGALTAFINAATTAGTCDRSSVGFEARNDVTSAFITGGMLSTIYESSSYYQYFGKDVDNVPIIATKDDPDNPWTLHARLNATPVADILSDNVYDCTITEMLAAETGEESWNNYIEANRPALAAIFTGMCLPPATQVGAPPEVNNVVIDAFSFTIANVQQQCLQHYNTNLSVWNRHRFYHFVLQQSKEYLGRKYLVQIPFMLIKEESETGRFVYSHKPADSGYVEGTPPLGLNTIYQDSFADVNGKYNCFVKYPFAGTDLSCLNNESYIVDGSGIYVSCSLAEDVIFVDSVTPTVIVTVSQTPRQKPLAAYGPDVTIVSLAYVAGATTSDTDWIRNLTRRYASGTIDYRLLQLPAGPTKFAVPIESNIATYGPWYAIGSQGKVQYKNDPDLVPWNYGGTSIMNLTADSMVVSAISFQQFNEMGEIEIVEEPSINLGDILLTTGPICTGIDVGYSDRGVTSTYRFQTFSPKFGLFAKQNAERFARMARGLQDIGKQVRQNVVKQNNLGRIGRDRLAFNTDLFFQDIGVRSRRQSTLPVISGIAVNKFSDQTKRRVECSITNFAEAPLTWMADVDEDYQTIGSMTLGGLFRPISTQMLNADTLYTNLPKMASYQQLRGNYNYAMCGTTVVSNCIDPFKNGNDIELVLKGDTYEDAHNVLRGSTGENNQRVIALRAPLVLTGWGYSNDDGWVPNQDPVELSGDILPNYLQKSHLWKTGPLELLWDDHRAVWTSFGMMLGVTVSDCGPNDGSTEVKLFEGSGREVTSRRKNRTAFNFFSKNVPAGSRVMCAWIPEALSWYILTADCQS